MRMAVRLPNDSSSADGYSVMLRLMTVHVRGCELGDKTGIGGRNVCDLIRSVSTDMPIGVAE